MRPLRSKGLSVGGALRDGAFAGAAVGDPVPALIDAFGPYCAICERPVRERAFAWDPVAGRTITDGAAAAAPVLLLCPTCEAVQARRRRPDGPLALPSEGISFTAESPRSFRYLRSGRVRPGPVGTESADATIRLFRLAGAGRDDPRPSLRAETWRTIDAVAAEVRRAPGTPDWLPQLMAATGFLSVWVSGLTQHLRGPEPVVDMLRSARERPEFFPGTDWAALEAPSPLRRPR
jgi:hypothetical protein